MDPPLPARTRVVLFAGAPAAATLTWDEQDLLTTFNEPIARFAGIVTELPLSPDLTKFSVGLRPPAWRSIPLEREDLKTGFGFERSFEEKPGAAAVPAAQGWLQSTEGTTFFTTSQVASLLDEEASQPHVAESFGSVVSVEEVLTQFYEESYARHADIPSSQLAPVSDHGSSVVTSFTTSEFSESFDSHTGLKDVPTAGNIHSLSSIPNANYLTSIHPQTMTVNLIVGIISISSPRAIRTRRGAEVELVEFLVGDETKSGFGINFWLASSASIQQPEFGQETMSTILQSLRPQDVILVRNVALSSFRNKVYGQSLRKDTTRVHLLYRNRVDKTDIGGVYGRAELDMGENKGAQIDKTRRVKEWVTRFIGAGAGKVKGKGRAEEARGEVLPDDTQ